MRLWPQIHVLWRDHLQLEVPRFSSRLQIPAGGNAVPLFCGQLTITEDHSKSEKQNLLEKHQAGMGNACGRDDPANRERRKKNKEIEKAQKEHEVDSAERVKLLRETLTSPYFPPGLTRLTSRVGSQSSGLARVARAQCSSR